MPAKKQTKKLTVGKLVKSKGKFDWRKLILLAVIFVCVGIIVVYSTLASTDLVISANTIGVTHPIGHAAMSDPVYNPNGGWTVYATETSDVYQRMWQGPNETKKVSSPSGIAMNVCWNFNQPQLGAIATRTPYLKMSVTYNNGSGVQTPFVKAFNYNDSSWKTATGPYSFKYCSDVKLPQGTYSNLSYNVAVKGDLWTTVTFIHVTYF